MVVEEASSSSSWSWEQEKAFENGLAIHLEEDLSDRWEKIAQEVEGKTIEEVKLHYELLVDDINEIESGRVPLPNYASSSEGVGDEGSSGSKKGGRGDSIREGKWSRAEQERRKGIAWSEEEHRLFLLGLQQYGKGDWRSISRNFVISRTPTQVASHAQKYYIRLNSMNKDRRRSSIHDITSTGINGGVSAPITGQANNGPVPVPVPGGGKPGKSSPQPVPGHPGVFGGTTIGQPVRGPAVGTPVSLPVPPVPHMAYGVRAPVGGSVVTGSPVNLPPPPMSYPRPHTSAHR